MLKNFSKVLLLLVLALSATSCSVEETQNVESEADYQTKKGLNNCLLDNPNRITMEIPTYGFFNFTTNGGSTCGLECLPNRLRRSIHTEFLKGPKGNSVQTNYANKIDIKWLSEIEDIPNLEIYPTIQPEYSNKIYRHIACIIQDHLSTLPTLPINQYYFPRTSYVKVDHLWNPQWNNSTVSFSYNVEILPY